MKIKNALILAGGLGTRLRSVIQDVPKPMAPINGQPFLKFILDYLYNYGFENIVLSVGYKHEMIQAFFGNSYRGMQIQYAVEKERLGTGGGIQFAATFFKGFPFFVMNGDTLFHADFWEMEHQYKTQNADMVMALKPMQYFERYGTVSLNSENKITSFNEKKYCEKGLINAGVYLMDDSIFLINNFNSSFSFEKDVMEKYCDSLNIIGVPSNGYFIDIGIPEDYEKANYDLKKNNLEKIISAIKTEKNWTLFLDRDGVINQRIPGNYVQYPNEFKFINGSDTAIHIFSKYFKIIVVVTNQQGVGKNIMAHENLHKVHEFMIEGINRVGGRVDKVYYCPELAKNNPKCRKQNIGMGLQAQKDFPDINFEKSVMVGDSISDIQFGNLLGMKTVFVETKNAKEIELAKNEDIDFQFADLISFAQQFEKNEL